ncbi:MAG: hypothetical protein WAS33_15350 [Candidatus Promineifilaceae bacterium]
MNRNSTYKQLAEALNIPLDQVHRLIEAVYLEYGQTTPEKLHELIRDKPEVKEWFRKKYKALFAPQIHEVAEHLTLSLPDAEALCRRIQEALPFAITESEIQSVIVENNATAENRIVAHLEIGWLARQLAASTENIKQLLIDLQELFARPITVEEILQHRGILDNKPAYHDVYNRFAEAWFVASEISQLLNISKDEAWRFFQQTWANWSRPVPATKIRRYLQVLKDKDKNLDVVAQILDYHFLSQSCNKTLKDVHQWISRLERDIGMPETRRQMIAALPFLPADSSEPYEIRVKTLLLIAHTLDKPVGEANQFILAVQSRCRRAVSYGEIAGVFNEMLITAVSVENLVSQIHDRDLAQQLALNTTEMQSFLEDLSQKVNLRLTAEDVLALDARTHGASPERIQTYYWQKAYPVPQIASLLGIAAQDVAPTLKNIRAQVHFEVGDEEILQALRTLPLRQNDVPNLIKQLYNRWIASQLKMPSSEVLGLVGNIQTDTQQKNLPSAQIATVLSLLPAGQRNASNLHGLFVTSHWWQKSPERTIQLILDALEKTIWQQPLEMFWPIARQIKPIHQNVEELITYLNISHWLTDSLVSPETINRLTGEVTVRKNAQVVEALIKASCTPDHLTLADFEYFLWLSGKTSYLIQMVQPDNRGTERWVTRMALKPVLVQKDYPNQEIYRQCESLRAYTKKCWKEICSEKREYQIPSAGRAELCVPDFATDLLHLTSLRFIQETVKAPGLYIQCKFEEPAMTGVMQIYPDGQMDGFHKLIDNEWCQAFITAIVMSHYRDFVVPTIRYASASNTPPRPRTNVGTSREWRTYPKNFPVKRSRQKQYSLSDWYESQQIARHNVRGHSRWIGPHFVADPIKYRQAFQAGVTLQRGYTWVLEHERGVPLETKIKLAGTDLVELTAFLPPPIASNELMIILSL